MQEVETGGSRILDQGKLKASLGYLRPCLKKRRVNQMLYQEHIRFLVRKGARKAG